MSEKDGLVADVSAIMRAFDPMEPWDNVSGIDPNYWDDEAASIVSKHVNGMPIDAVRVLVVEAVGHLCNVKDPYSADRIDAIAAAIRYRMDGPPSQPLSAILERAVGEMNGT